MKMWHKLFFSCLAMITLLVASVGQFAILPHFERLERQAAVQQIEQLRHNIAQELTTLANIVLDYASYTPQQPITATHHWATSFPENLFSNHDLHGMAIYTADGQLLFSQRRDGDTGQLRSFRPRLCDSILRYAAKNSQNSIKGLMATPEGIMMIAAQAMPPNQPTAQPLIIIFCRQLDAELIRSGSKLFYPTVAILPAAQVATDPLADQAQRQLSENHPIYLSSTDDTRLQAYTRLIDLEQKNIGLLQLTLPRDSYLNIQQQILISLLSLSLILSILVLALIHHLRKKMIQPYKQLTRQVHRLRQMSDRTALSPTDDTEGLTTEINGLLRELASSRLNQNLSELQTSLIRRVVPCAILTVDHQRTITSWNERASQLTGYSEQEMVGSSYFRFIPAPSHPATLEECAASPSREYTIRHKNGTLMTISKNTELLRDTEGQITGGIECFVDITPHKRNKDALQWEVALNSRLSSLCQTMVAHSDNDNEISKHILAHARDLTGSFHGFIAELEQGDNQRLWNYTSLFEEFSSQEGGALIPAAPSGRGSLLHAVYNRKTGVYFNDLKQLNVTHLAGGIDKPFCHFMAVPVCKGKEIIGQIALANNKDGYSVRDLEAVEQLADLFALFLSLRRQHQTQPSRKNLTIC